MDNLNELARFVLKFPDRCCAEVTRKGRSEPCDLPAVATATSTEAYDPGWWPVCRKHVRGRKLVPLRDVLAAQKDAEAADCRWRAAQKGAQR